MLTKNPDAESMRLSETVEILRIRQACTRDHGARLGAAIDALERVRELLPGDSKPVPQAGTDWVSSYVRENASRTGTPTGRNEVAREIFTVLYGYVECAAKELGFDLWYLQMEYSKFWRRAALRAKETPVAGPLNREDCEFLAVLLKNPSLRKRVAEALRGVALEPCPLVEVLNKLLSGNVDRLSESLKGEARRLFTAAASLDEMVCSDLEELVSKRTAGLKKDALRAQATRMQEAIQEAERAHDPDRVRQLLEKQRQLVDGTCLTGMTTRVV